MIPDKIEGVPVFDVKPKRPIGKKNSVLVGGSEKQIAEEIRYLRRIGIDPTAVVWEQGQNPVVYIGQHKVAFVKTPAIMTNSEYTSQQLLEKYVKKVTSCIANAGTRVRLKTKLDIETKITEQSGINILAATICPVGKTGIRIDVEAVQKHFNGCEINVHPFLSGLKRNINVPCVRFLANRETDKDVIMIDVFLFPVDFKEL